MSSFLLPLRQWLADNFRVALPLFFGVLGTSIPFGKKMRLVVGRPIEVRKCENEEPTSEEIDALHELFVSELERVVEDSREEYEREVGTKMGELELI